MPSTRLPAFSALAVLLAVAARADAPDLKSLISRADLVYPAPVTRSEDGMPLGNGRMGSLVWTTPTSVRLQVNRVDVQPISATTTSFFERNSDYMGGCGFVDLDLGAAGGDVFTPEHGPQRLSVYDARLTMAGRDVTIRAVASPGPDVFAFEVDDRRPAPQPITINLRMLRYLSQYFGADLETLAREHAVAVRTREHTATSRLAITGRRIVLTQDFREHEHVAKSAVAIEVLGREARARFTNETTVTLAAPAAAGRVLVLVASAATLNPDEDIAATALTVLDRTERIGRDFDALAADTAAWWHAFWARGSLALHSADGTADEVGAAYHYFLYLMAATSRGRFPPKFNGMLWNTAGDVRTWGAQHWFANLSCYYETLFASNRLELLDPMFDMYSGMAEACALAARQQWGSEGIYIPETVWYDGLAPLPDDIAAEMRDLYLMRKPWAQRSARFMEYASTRHPHSSRWNWWGGGSFVNGRWVPTERGHGPFGPVTHILGSTAKVAYLYWRRYEYAPDRGWLQSRAYPMLRGAAEFYRHFPNLQPDEHGVLHMHHTNSNESVQDVRDSDEDLSAMRGVFAAAIRAAEILDRDPELRAAWRTTLDHLAPLPTTADADALKPANDAGPAVFARGRTPAVVSGWGVLPDPNSLPEWFFDLCNRDNADPQRLAVANASFDRYLRGAAPGRDTAVGVLSKLAIAGTTLGRVDATRFMVPNQIRLLTRERPGAYGGGGVLANRLTLREGPQAFDAQRLGRAAEALEIALLNSAPPAPAAEPALRVFSAWPPEWDATFTLRARGGFVVSAAQHGGRVTYVDVVSEAGTTLRLHNPWGDAAVKIRRAGGTETLSGAILRVPTQRGEQLRLSAD